MGGFGRSSGTSSWGRTLRNGARNVLDVTSHIADAVSTPLMLSGVIPAVGEAGMLAGAGAGILGAAAHAAEDWLGPHEDTPEETEQKRTAAIEKQTEQARQRMNVPGGYYNPPQNTGLYPANYGIATPQIGYNYPMTSAMGYNPGPGYNAAGFY